MGQDGYELAVSWPKSSDSEEHLLYSPWKTINVLINCINESVKGENK